VFAAPDGWYDQGIEGAERLADPPPVQTTVRSDGVASTGSVSTASVRRSPKAVVMVTDGAAGAEARHAGAIQTFRRCRWRGSRARRFPTSWAFLQLFLVLYLVHRFTETQSGVALARTGRRHPGTLFGGGLSDRLGPR
jgi:hypothetical protein